MARSRLEKVGTIYTRTHALINSGAMGWEERPLWYDIYETFPPKDEPRFDRPVPNMKLKEIFYEEDNIRAIFHKNYKQIGVVNMLNNKKTVTQRFIENYKKLETQYQEKGNLELYQEAVELLRRRNETNEDVIDTISLKSMFQNGQSKQASEKIHNISNIFKE